MIEFVQEEFSYFEIVNKLILNRGGVIGLNLKDD
jgi:hypothetical protein